MQRDAISVEFSSRPQLGASSVELTVHRPVDYQSGARHWRPHGADIVAFDFHIAFRRAYAARACHRAVVRIFYGRGDAH
jgi:hypothetical protein